jgi:hypothetical protein
MKLLQNQKGQGMSEIVLMLPLFLILAAGSISIAYMCWQGIKVQQAANLAARIQGQERVSGGVSQQSISRDNGMEGMGDQVPDEDDVAKMGNGANMSGWKSRPSGGVYGRFYDAVHTMFSKNEQNKLFVPPPINQGINTDTVQVVRVLTPPKILDFQLKPIRLEAKAYGGEDSHMYALPRWGSTANNNDQFYTTAITNPDGQ